MYVIFAPRERVADQAEIANGAQASCRETRVICPTMSSSPASSACTGVAASPRR